MRLPTVVAAAAALLLAGVAWGAQVTGFRGCNPAAHQPQVRPRSILLRCGDGNFYVAHLRWSSWRPWRAVAAGTAYHNDCKPTCAAGHFRTYAATIVLTQPHTCADGVRQFALARWTFVAAKPVGVPRSGSLAFGCPA
jgi:hypothetical protein